MVFETDLCINNHFEEREEKLAENLSKLSM